MKLGWLPAAKLLAWSTLSRADPVAGCGHCQLSREIRQCLRGGQFAADTGEAVFGGTEPGQSHPYRLVVAEQQPGRRLCLAFAFVD
jgi:hypothetical protein